MSNHSHPHNLRWHLMTQPHHDHCASRTKGDGMRCDCWKGDAERLLADRDRFARVVRWLAMMKWDDHGRLVAWPSQAVVERDLRALAAGADEQERT